MCWGKLPDRNTEGERRWSLANCLSVSPFKHTEKSSQLVSFCPSPASLCPLPQPLSLLLVEGPLSITRWVRNGWHSYSFEALPGQGQTRYATSSSKAAPKADSKPPRLNLGPPVLSRTLSVGPGPQRLHWANGNRGWQLVTLCYSFLLDLGPSGDNGCRNPC